MNRGLLIVVIAITALAAAWVALDRLAPAPASSASGSRAASGEPAPTRIERPEPTSAPAPKAEAPRTSARRRAAPTPEIARAPAPAPEAVDVATLRIETDVPGAQVFIDRVFVGQAPVTAQNVKPGSHRINVSSAGYDGVAETVDVARGPREIVIRLKEVRLDAKLDVIHKHRFGSCRGQLSATPKGIRYETTDKNDRFAVALADMEGFDVDYLKKNLRLKLRTGRQYDFTDPEGNADRLFVFHRDVAKAAEKLKAASPP